MTTSVNATDPRCLLPTELDPTMELLDTFPQTLLPSFADNLLEHHLPLGTRKTFTTLMRQPARLALVKSVTLFPLDGFGQIFGQEWLCRNVTLTQALPVLCGPKSVVWDLRNVLHPPLKKRGVEALVLIVDSYVHTNKSLDLPPASHLMSSSVDVELSTLQFLRLSTWTLARHVHPHFFPTREFGLDLPMVSPGRVFHPHLATLIPTTVNTCVFLDFGRTAMCASFPRFAEIHFVTLYQWLEFARQQLLANELQIVQGPCVPKGDPEQVPSSCPANEVRLSGVLTARDNGNISSWNHSTNWLHAVAWFPPFRCPDVLFSTPEQSGCDPRHFQRYQEVLDYFVVTTEAWRDVHLQLPEQ